MMSEEDTSKFCVVEFEDKTQHKNGLRSVDLIPRLWLQRSKNKWESKYPPRKDYKYIDKWVKEEKPPESHWRLYKVAIISWAIDYAQGKRRLQRAYESREIALSSDLENCQSKPVCFSQDTVHKMLHTTLPMTQMDDDRCSIESSKKNKKKKSSQVSVDSISEFSDGSDISVSSQAEESRKRIDNKLTPSVDNGCREIISPVEDQFQVQWLKDMEDRIIKRIKSAKQSILYTLNQKMEEIKLSVVAQNIPKIPAGTFKELVTNLGIELPIETINEFLVFENQLDKDEEKKSALIALFQYLCFECSTIKNCIESALPKIKGFSKRNFSATCTFDCFKVVIMSKFSEPDCQTLSLKVGLWLSHYGDREGGRRQRQTEQ